MRDPRALALLVAGLAGLLSTRCGDRPARRSSSTERLVEAVAAALPERRPVEPRLSGSFAWQPCSRSETGSLIEEGRCRQQPWSRAERRALDGVAALVHQALPGRRDAGAHHAAGLLDLLVSGGARAADGAVSSLRRAAELAPERPAVWSDLAAAHLVRAATRGDPRGLIAAFAAADQALRRDADHAPARFNRNLALERLMLHAAAADGWREVRAVDPDSPWSREAGQRLEALASPPPAAAWDDQRRRLDTGDDGELDPRLFRLARLHVEDVLLPAWGDRQKAGGELAAARVLAAKLGAATGDRLLERSVATIDGAVADPPRLANLAAGHRSYGRARRLHEAQDYDGAEPLFEAARDRLRAAGSPFERWASFYLAVGDYHRGDHGAALEALHALRHRCREEPYAVLRGRVLWVLGLTQVVRGQPQAAEHFYRQARGFFDDAGEIENRAAMDNLLARVLDQLGRGDDAWTHRYRALGSLPEVASCRRQSNLLTNWLDRTLEDHPRLSALFRDELVRRSRACGNPLLTAIALHRSIRVERRLGRPEAATAALAEGERRCAEIPAGGTRETVQMDLLREHAAIESERDPARAVALLAAAKDSFKARGYRLRRIEVERELARAHLDAGDPAMARKSLDAGRQEVEDQAATVEPRHRSRFLRVALPLFQELTALELAHGEPAAALAWSERARAFALRAMAGSLRSRTPAPPVPLAGIQAALGEDERMVVFEALPRELALWLISPTGLEVERRPIAAAELGEKVSALRAELRAGRSESAEASGLHRLLLGDLAKRIPAGSRLAIVPGGPLHELPFGALRAADGRLWIDRHTLAVAPSAAVYLASRERGQVLGTSRSPASVLAVGNPAFDRGAIQPQLVEGSTLHEFRNRRYLQLGGQHLTLAVDSQENLSFLRAREPAARTPEDYSFVISAQKLLKERVPELAGQPIPALKSELTKVPYRVPDGERQQLIARLKLDQGRVSTLKRWGEEDGGPAHRFKFADATLPGNEHLARQVVVELQVKGQGRLMQQALNGEGDAGNQKTPLITFEAEADGTVELTFVTGKAHDADPEHLGNHFRGVYQLFGVDELDALEDVALPRPFNASSGTDGDGACTIIQNGGP